MSGVKLVYHNEGPCEYFTVGNILPVNEYETAKFELDMFRKIFKSPENTGSATREGSLLKQNSGVFLTDVLSGDDRHASSLLVASINVMRVFMEYVKEKLAHKHSAFGQLAHDINYSTLLSGYKDGDYYNPHRDSSVATLIWWLMEPEEEHEGGKFILSDLGVEVSPESYTGVIIPSWYRHEVSTIKSGSNDFVRYAVSCFMDEAR